MKAELKTVTPEMAAEWLKKNNRNRKLSLALVDLLSNEIKNGNWQQNGDTIRFDDKGLLDGQHRLHAIIKAGKPVDTFVVTGLETDSMRTIDTDRRPRSTGAVLQLAGEVDTNVLSGAIRVVLDMREDTKWKRSSRLLPKRTFFDFLDNEPSVRDSVRFAQNLHSLKKLAGPTVPAGLYHMFSSVAKKEAQKFFNDLNDGLNLSPRDPAYLLRQRLIDNSASRSKLERTVVMALFTKAWNARLRGDEMRQLKWNPAVEEFPEVSREVAVA